MGVPQWWERNVPGVYYGWLIVAASTLAILCACPGQSFGACRVLYA
jgi:hypothetical protein